MAPLTIVSGPTSKAASLAVATLNVEGAVTVMLIPLISANSGCSITNRPFFIATISSAVSA